MIGRRDFLAGTASLGLAAALPKPAFAQTKPPMSTLGTVHLSRAVMANGQPLPAGTYQVRVISDSLTPAVGQSLEGERWVAWPAILMIVSMATLVRSYVAIKLFFLALFLLAFLVKVYLRKTTIVMYPRLVWFYLCIGLAGVVWAFVGVLNYRNYIDGVFDAIRLYVVWSVAFVVLYTLLRAAPSLDIIHKAMVLAGIIVPVINLVALYDQLSGGGLISEGIRQELDMEVGFGDGYLQFNSINISTMFLTAPYLLSLQFRADAGKSNSLLTKMALVLSLVLVILSGRRALWIVVALTPCSILFLSYLTGSYSLIKAGGKRVLLACATTAIVGLGTILIVPEGSLGGEYTGSVTRLKQSFSSEDERTIQKPYLMDAFMESPVFGSGFGATAGYIRSDIRPWRYELTYYQMLFNLGIVGVTVLGVLFSLYFATVIRLLREYKHGSAVPLALLVAYCSLFVGAYSDPYFGGFDPWTTCILHGLPNPILAKIFEIFSHLAVSGG